VAEGERVRLEIAFEGQQVLSVSVPIATAEDLDRALGGESDGSFTFEAEDGRYTLSLRRIVYVKRFQRESRVGFGALP
jgi:hypothetical protein